MLTLYKLEIFHTVSEEGSFSRAAERLRLTQPAVSQHIRDLEERLGKTLFQRSNRGVRLTAAGKLLLDYTRCILRMLAEAESAIARPQGSHTRAWTDQLFTRNGISPQIVVEFDNPEAILQAVAAGVGISLLPEWAIPDRSTGARVRKIRVQGARLNRTLRLVWSENRALSSAAQAFLAHLSEPFPNLSQLLAAGRTTEPRLREGDQIIPSC
jgi:DNA-binding transcriptional LysR family regulator